jgi:four helix bundle protein
VVDGVERLEVYGRAMDLVEEAYRLTRKLPRSERFGLVSQIQRAATSIPMNIAEGYGRRHRGDYIHLLSIARGSAFELETQVAIVVRLGFIDHAEVAEARRQTLAVKQMLTRLINRLAAETNDR